MLATPKPPLPQPRRASRSQRALVTLLTAATLATPGCDVRLRPLPDSVEAEVEDAINRGFDGIVVYVDQPGGSRFYSAGWKDREARVPADPHALFKIASISKLYIAAATTMLVADGELSLDSTLQELVPETGGEIDNAETITLRMMLGHRSGIPEYIYNPDFTNDPDESYLATASLVFGQPADFEPDAGYSYSNTNYLLIGEILDRTLGYTHHAYIASEILAPLELHDTYSLFSEVDPDAVMSGYYVGYEPDLKTLDDHTRPGGSMVASAEDVGVFLRALIDGTLFTPEEQAIYSSVYEYEHTGWVGGYTSIARYHPDIDAVVVQFVNTSHDGLFWIELERVYGRIVSILERGDRDE
ncbi:MAG: beta-lactamase family protein [Alphaproteobacteria bacterium]|nr:beta-lactamase family protein [Alphaproteobacteria bacterium]